jgi:hypothetical protein
VLRPKGKVGARARASVQEMVIGLFLEMCYWHQGKGTLLSFSQCFMYFLSGHWKRAGARASARVTVTGQGYITVTRSRSSAG